MGTGLVRVELRAADYSIGGRACQRGSRPLSSAVVGTPEVEGPNGAVFKRSGEDVRLQVLRQLRWNSSRLFHSLVGKRELLRQKRRAPGLGVPLRDPKLWQCALFDAGTRRHQATYIGSQILAIRSCILVRTRALQMVVPAVAAVVVDEIDACGSSRKEIIRGKFAGREICLGSDNRVVRESVRLETGAQTNQWRILIGEVHRTSA